MFFACVCILCRVLEMSVSEDFAGFSDASGSNNTMQHTSRATRYDYPKALAQPSRAIVDKNRHVFGVVQRE